MFTKREAYREVVATLYDKHNKTVFGRAEASKILGISKATLDRRLADGKIEQSDGGKITIGAIARYVC